MARQMILKRIEERGCNVSADLEHLISKEIRALSDAQQREVLAFVERLKHQSPSGRSGHLSFIGIGHSGKKDLSQRTEEILEEAANRREGWSLTE